MSGLTNKYFPRRTVLLTLTEALLVAACFFLAVLLSSGSAAEAQAYLWYDGGAGRIGLVVLIFLVLMFYFDLYHYPVLTNRREVVTRLVGVLGMTFLTLAVVYYSFPDASLGGYVLWIGILAASVAVPVWRLLFFAVNSSASFAERALIYGDGPLAAQMIDAIIRRAELGVRVTGFVGSQPVLPGIPIVAVNDVASFVQREGVRRIIVTMGDRRGKLDVGQLLQLKARGVQIQDGPEYFETVTGKIPIDSLRLRWLLFSRGFHVRPALHAYKRIFSLLFGTVAAVFSSPLMLCVAVAVRLNSEGPILDRQKCVGEFGAPFTAYKFRTKFRLGTLTNDSIKNENPAAAGTTSQSDLTSVGRWLRKTRLDELPRLLNIIKGDLSFVGPQPVPLSDEEHWERAIPYYKERWLIKPGITGWAQINRKKASTIEDQKDVLAYDLFYIKNVSIGLDLYILISTLKILMIGRTRR